jgi:hypothetical protein
MSMATNLVPFKPRPAQRVHKFKALTVFIDDTAPLQDGDLVAWTMPNKSGECDGRTMFGHWYGPEGRDGNGRFCHKGSPDEIAHIEFFKYCARDVERGLLKIYGKVVWALAPDPAPVVISTD